VKELGYRRDPAASATRVSWQLVCRDVPIFGIYVYHVLAMALVVRYGPTLIDAAPRALWWLRLATTLVLSIAMAAVSYLLWERRFLRLKTRYERIPSRPP
jgi:peptidoglycan/LPS O-acetylase OafA/YrhL